MRILVNEFCGHAFQIELSRELARRGHSVLHLYFADNLSTPKGDLESAAGGGDFAIEGLHIPFPFDKLSLRTRRKADLAYGREVAARLLSFRPDVVLSANTPLDAQSIIQKAAHAQGARFYFWLQDVYSSAVRFVLKRKLGPLAGLAGAYYERIERRLLCRSQAVVSISPGFGQIATGWGVEPRRSFVIENWAPLDEVVPTPKDNAWAREQGLDGKFCFMYSGTLGMKHRPELLLDLAKFLETRSDARLVVIAGGAGADWLREHASQVSPQVLKLLPFQPYNRLSEVLGSSDALIALLDAEAGAFAVPSKVLSYLSAGRTLLLAAPSENHAAAVVSQAGAGLVLSSESSAGILAAAHQLLSTPARCAKFASSARAYAEHNFNIQTIADRFLEVFSVA